MVSILKRYWPAIVIAVLALLFVGYQVTAFPMEDEIDRIDAVAEGTVTLVLLAGVIVVQRLRAESRTYYPLLAGTTLLFTSMLADLSGEFVDEPDAFTLLFEDLAAIPGALLLVAGLYHWVNERQRRIESLREQSAALERQNRRLERVATAISHDIRNPLNVASGRLELAEREVDSDHLPVVDEALERVERIVADVLAFARDSRTVLETERVSLEAVARDAWGSVDATDCELRVETDCAIAADPERLQRLLENLFRNSLEHGDARTIRIVDTPAGFAVVDDGAGISPDERETVFEFGYTTDADGTGFGLAIVTAIAEAHGWTVDVTAGERDGARFEFENVDFPAPTRSNATANTMLA